MKQNVSRYSRFISGFQRAFHLDDNVVFVREMPLLRALNPKVVEDFRIASMLENLLVDVLGLTALNCTRHRKIRYDNTPYLKSYEPGEQVLLRVSQVWQHLRRSIQRPFSNGNYHLSNYAHNPVHGDCLISYSNCNDLIPDVGIQLSIAAGANPQELYRFHFTSVTFRIMLCLKGRIESLLRPSSTSRSPVISNRPWTPSVAFFLSLLCENCSPRINLRLLYSSSYL
jgi:hypothetical protein